MCSSIPTPPTKSELEQMLVDAESARSAASGRVNTINMALYHLHWISRFETNLRIATTQDADTVFGDGRDMPVAEYLEWAKNQLAVHETEFVRWSSSLSEVSA